MINMTAKDEMTYTHHRRTKAGEDRYTGYYHLPERKITDDGKLKLVAVSAGTVGTEEEALALADAKQSEVDAELAPTPELRATMTIARLLPIFLQRHHVAANTLDGHRQHLTKYAIRRIGKIKVNDLTKPTLQNLLDRLRDDGVTPSALQHLRSALVALIGYAHRVGLRDDNCARGLSVPKTVRQGQRSWASDVFTAVSPHFATDAAKTFATLMVLTGARISELCALLAGDIDLTTNTLSITKALVVINGKHNDTRLKVTKHPKNGLFRTVELSRLAADLLATYITENQIGKDDQLFPHHLIYGYGKKELLGPDNWAYTFRKAFEASGLPKSLWIPPKNLRHTHVIDCLEKLGMPPALVAKRIGNTAEVLLSNYVVERLTATPSSNGHLDALDDAYTA